MNVGARHAVPLTPQEETTKYAKCAKMEKSIMAKGSSSTPRFVVCINNTDYPASLELHKIYKVVPDDEARADGDMRVVDESGEDYIYPASYFIAIEVPHALEESMLHGLKEHARRSGG